MRPMSNWYMDNNQYCSEAFAKKMISYTNEAIQRGIGIKDVVATHEPNRGNPSSQITCARDLGIIGDGAKLTDASILFDAGVISYEDFVIDAISKRNITKTEQVYVKPLVLLCIFFSKLNKLSIDISERFITKAECYEYLSVIESYDEFTDDVVLALIHDRSYPSTGTHVPIRRIESTNVSWLCFFSMLGDSALFSLTDEKECLSCVDLYQEVVDFIADRGKVISLAPQTIGKNNKSLYDYYSNVETGLLEIIPPLPCLKKTIPNYFTNAFFDCVFGVTDGSNFPSREYFSDDINGMYRIFFPVRRLVATKIYVSNPSLGEALFDYIRLCGKYSESIFGEKLMITKPFSGTPHTALSDLSTKPVYITGFKSSFPRNLLVVGAPGTGKSFKLNQDKAELLSEPGCADNYERVTFHPEYTYSNFVGAYKPIPSNSGVSYEFVPGPFIRLYVKALRSARNGEAKPFLLIIEELNRANTAGVFGDIFQLLDRDKKTHLSEYSINASEELKTYLAKPTVLGGTPEDYAMLTLPDNFFIWATLNPADQGVNPLDTAFKRRWSYRYMGIDQGDELIDSAVITINSKEYNWNKVRKAINAKLSAIGINEDKLIGPFFVPLEDLPHDKDTNPNYTLENAAFLEMFKSKVIMYLFSDVVKSKQHVLFSSGVNNQTNIRVYSSICNSFDSSGFDIFVEEITKAI